MKKRVMRFLYQSGKHDARLKMQCPRAETAWLGWRPVDFPDVRDTAIVLSARKTSLHMARGVPASVLSSQLHPQGSARQSTAKTPASVPFLKMKTDIIRRVSFLGDPVAFWRGREGRGGNKPGRPGSPLGSRAPGAKIWSFSHQKLVDSSNSTAPLMEMEAGVFIFSKRF